VLVKEVRAALRGRAFAFGFTGVLALALVSSTIALVAGATSGARGGAGYLAAVSWVFALGAHGLVPFSAMASMAAEHDEGALELLQLSGLSAGRVVLGKLGAAAVQAALIYAAYLPFLSFAALLPGIDVTGLASGIAASFAASLAFCSVGILAGASLKRRWQRVLGYVGLVLVLIFGLQVLAFATVALTMGGALGGGPGSFALAMTFSVCAVVTALCCALAAARLTHAEENRTSAFRAIGTAALVLGCAFGLQASAPDELVVWLLAGFALGFPALFLGLTEPNRLPRAVHARMARRGGAWVLLTPWLPGGGRAVLLLGLHVLLVLGFGLLGALRLRPADSSAHLGQVALVLLYASAVLLLPSGALARGMDWLWAQIVARVAILALPIAALLVPALLAFLGGAGPEAFRHAGNPAHLPLDLLADGRIDDVRGLVVLGAAAALGLALNLSRTVRALRDLPRARRASAEGTAEGAAGAASQR
jgi:hypothetical protein